MRLLIAFGYQRFLFFIELLEFFLNGDLGCNSFFSILQILCHVTNVLVRHFDRVFRFVDNRIHIGHSQITQSFKNRHCSFLQNKSELLNCYLLRRE
ncbi:hypothetical protein D3C85_1357000 [compost metagenome]